MITGKTQVFGLIGNPVAQSFSPYIHNSLAEAMNIDMTYVTFPVEKVKLSEAYRGIKALGIGGANVTVPYKSDIINEIDAIDPEAANIGAVNTLVYEEGKSIRGYNTDWIGLLTSLKSNLVTIEGKSVLIIGAGGSARAVGVMCAKEKAAKVTVANRTVSKAEAIAAIVAEKYDVVSRVVTIDQAQNLEDVDIVIQTTPLGMYPDIERSPISGDDFLKNAEVAVDLIYNPAETKFLATARQQGCKTINGLEMLFYQAVKAFELWHDLTVPKEVQAKCLEAFKKALEEKYQYH